MKTCYTIVNCNVEEYAMRILGIDPGYAIVGFGLIEADRGSFRMLTYGVITTEAGLPLSRRLYQIASDMEKLLFCQL